MHIRLQKSARRLRAYLNAFSLQRGCPRLRRREKAFSADSGVSGRELKTPLKSHIFAKAAKTGRRSKSPENAKK
jgi:hypothetical protein